MPLSILLTGASGMIGRSALNACLADARVGTVLSVGRRNLAVEHPKLRQVVVPDFTDFTPLRDALTEFRPDACFHCMGVSSVGMDEAQYSRLTFDATKGLADLVFGTNPNACFVYVSGAGTDSTESGSLMWARVKGKTENYVLQKGFRGAYAFRIGAVLPMNGEQSKTGWVNTMYRLFRPAFGLLGKLSAVTTSERVGRAMINLTAGEGGREVLDNQAIDRIGRDRE